MPSNYLETVLWLESDRMGFLLDSLDIAKLNAQRDIVKNERRQGVDNQPYGSLLSDAVESAPCVIRNRNSRSFPARVELVLRAREA